MSSQVKVCPHGLGNLSCAACDVAPTSKFVIQFSWSYNTGMAITDRLLCPWTRGFSPHRVQDMQFHINIDIVARVFLVTRFMHAFCRSRHTNGPEAFSSLHALRSSIHFGIGFVVQRLFWHAIYAWLSRIGLLPGGPTDFAFQDDHVHI